MGLSQALVAAVSGLRATQTGLSLVAGNVANANTPGYVRKTITPVAVSSNGVGISVQTGNVQRELDKFVQSQLRSEQAGASYADMRSQFFGQLQSILGTPGSSSSLESGFNNFVNSLQALTTSPDDPSAQSGVVTAAQALTQQLNSMSNSIQGLRANAELGLSDSVSSANTDIQRIAQLNAQISSSSTQDGAYATLLDQRDAAIDDLSKLMDIKVVQGNNNTVTVSTTSGVQLVGLQPVTLQFDAKGTITPASQWSADPTKRSVGTITVVSPSGASIDLIQTDGIRSGQIAAYLQMRDQDLVQAQNQLDALATSMSQAVSDRTTAGSAIGSPPVTGFSVDTTGLANGNSIEIDYTDTLTNTQHALTLVRVDDPGALPLPNTATTNPNDTVVGIDFSGGMSSVAAQISAALAGKGMTVSNSGATLNFLNGGSGMAVNITGASTTITQTGTINGGPQVPLFVDGNQPFTGTITAYGQQSIGYAGRISINQALAADPSKLVQYAAGTASGDATRPNFIYDQLVNASLTYAPNTGIGTTTAPFSGSVSTFLRQVISAQSNAADAATNLKQGQDVVLNSLQQRYNQGAGVNVDEEMSNLLTLQNAYAANARVLSAVKDMFDLLMQM
ncbi:MAG: flagellar hook-associated protein FlgK [Pseudolabrys sp.]|nr:flagellar hook-associated protein FlgK [Pseudolabrys sp.]